MKTQYQVPADLACEGNNYDYIIHQLLGEYAFIDLVVVREVLGGKLTVTSLLCSKDSKGNRIENQPVFEVPYLRLQRGGSAVIMDPVVGDIGLMAVCDKDTSIARETKSASSIPSMRQHAKCDGVYLTGIGALNQVPTQYIHFTDIGINIKSPGVVNINGVQILPDGRLQLVNGVIVDTHVHGGVESGKSTTQVPQ